jgi:senataxin
VGFLADVRRMNVAITRAKQALWVLGSAATLGRSPVWAALLGNARERGVVIRDAHARHAPASSLQFSCSAVP